VAPLVGHDDALSIAAPPPQRSRYALMDREPLTRLGIRTYGLYPWDLREGRMTIQLDASTSSLWLGRPFSRLRKLSY
jgi:hypothetical protein